MINGVEPHYKCVKHKESLLKTGLFGGYDGYFGVKKANIEPVNLNFKKRWKPIMLFLMPKKAT